MSKKLETIENSEETVDLGRRSALSRLGLAATAAYAAPVLMTLSQSAHASGGDGGSSSGGGGGGGSNSGGSDSSSGSSGPTSGSSGPTSGTSGTSDGGNDNFLSDEVENTPT